MNVYISIDIQKSTIYAGLAIGQKKMTMYFFVEMVLSIYPRGFLLLYFLDLNIE